MDARAPVWDERGLLCYRRGDASHFRVLLGAQAFLLGLPSPSRATPLAIHHHRRQAARPLATLVPYHPCHRSYMLALFCFVSMHVCIRFALTTKC